MGVAKVDGRSRARVGVAFSAHYCYIIFRKQRNRLICCFKAPAGIPMLWFQYTKMNRPYRLRHRAALEDIDPRQIPYIFTLTVYFSMSSLTQVGRASSMSGTI